MKHRIKHTLITALVVAIVQFIFSLFIEEQIPLHILRPFVAALLSVIAVLASYKILDWVDNDK